MALSLDSLSGLELWGFGAQGWFGFRALEVCSRVSSSRRELVLGAGRR